MVNQSVVLVVSLYGDSKFIHVEDILYIMANRNKCMVYTSDGKSHEIGDAMTSVEPDLDPTMFLKIHRSYIINIKYLYSCNYSSVKLTDGTELPIGDSFRQSFKSNFIIWGPRKRNTK